MAAPNYLTDLNDITTSDALGTWIEMPTHKSGSAPVNETDYYIQGTACASQATGGSTGIEAGIIFDYTANISPFNTGDCIFMWQVLLAGNNIHSFEAGGMRVYIGSGSSDIRGWKTGGDSFGRNPYGGWQNVAVDPTYPYDYTEGTPAAGQYRWFGSLPNLRAAISKGNMHAVDAIRWGRGTLIVSGGEVGDYATFEGMAGANDAQANRWGLFQEQFGSYLWKGKMQLGEIQREQHTAGYPVNFDDRNRVIYVDRVPRTYRDFNKIEIRNASSTINWDGVQISALSAYGLLSPGKFDVIENANVNLTGCQFTDMDTFTFKSNSSMDVSTWRRCDSVIQNDALFYNCIFTSHRVNQYAHSSAVSATDLDNIQYCQFIQANRNGGHGLECSVSGSYDFYGNTFTGFGASGTPSAAFYNNSGGDITLNILANGDSPTVYNAPDGSHTIINLAVTYTITGIVSGSEVQIVTQTGEIPLYHLENTTEDDGTGFGTTKATYTYSYSDFGQDVPIYFYIHNIYYRWFKQSDVLTNTSKVVPITQSIDPWYNNP